jgi:signal transduction histidine kinase
MEVRQAIDRFGDQALAVALAVGIELEVWASSPANLEVRGGRAALAVVALFIPLPLAWRRRAPLLVLATMLVAFAFAFLLITRGDGSPLSALLAFLIALYTVGAQTDGRRAVIGLAGGEAAIVAIDFAFGGVFQDVGVRPGVWFVLAVAWGIGREVRRRRLEIRRLRDRAAELELEREERARTAAAEERARIARELHDVVAHSVSVMVVQAQAADRVLEGDEPAAREVLATIENTGRQALTELRRLLGLLRRAEDAASVTPQPSLRHLEALAQQMRASGLPVELVVEGEPVALPQGLDLSAYRIVQEGLTNALKHAGPARASVLIRYSPAEVEVVVADDGRGRNGAAGAGQGLVGMRERVALYGGELSTGSADDGGFVLRARLPLAAGA